MKKFLPLCVVGILVVCGFGSAALTQDGTYDLKNLRETMFFSEPIVEEQKNFVTLRLEEPTSFLSYPGKPMLPVVTRVYTLPFGSKIRSVDVIFSEPFEMRLSKKVQPASQPVPLDTLKWLNVEIEEDPLVYGSAEFYPREGYSSTVGVGLNGEERVVYLVVRCFPVRYSPKENMIYYSEQGDVEIVYEEPVSPVVFPDEYDLVIIAPEEFSAVLQPLVAHKNSFGVDTVLKTTEEIYREYSGVDKPEQIKYFIKDAIEKWDVRYVLLVGGLNSLIYAKRKDDCNQGSRDWFVPVRYSNNEEMGTFDPGFISDLYYADIYDSEYNFSSWDTNNDGVFAGWRFGARRDILDLYPDVFVGRLACRNTYEVKTMVDKIINYESSCDPSWFRKIVLVGGDTFDDVDSTNYYEGEVENQKALDYLTDFESVKIWSSNRNTGGPVPEPEDIVRIVSEGCGFLFFAGHGSAERWNTYWAEGFDEERAKGLWWFNMAKLSNGDKLPVCVVGGCHNSQFNVTTLCFLNYWLNKIGKMFNIDFLRRWPGNVYTPLPECWSWFLTRKPGGGSIATIGNTGTGYGAIGNHGDLDGDGIDDPDCIETKGGYIEIQFFKAYGEDNVDILGEAWGQAVTTYINVYPGMQDQIDCKTVQQWALLGDPSLKIGGYA